MAIIKEVREKLNKGQNIFRRVLVELLVEEYSLMQRMVEDMRTQYNAEFLPELETAKQKVQSLETDLIQARRVADERQAEIEKLLGDVKILKTERAGLQRKLQLKRSVGLY